ncbi:MAG: YceI family protein [Planctomycetota bacterium]
MKKTLGLIALVAALAGPVYAGTTTWKIDVAHTTTMFKIQHLGAGKFIGRFNDTQGTIVWDDADPTKSTIEVVVKVDSVDTANADRDKHLKNEDFFAAKQHPKITFKSTKVEKDGDKFKVTGDLTMHGVTKPVTAAFEITGKGHNKHFNKDLIGAEASFKIKRSDFGMDKMVGTDGVGDEVEITIGVEATKE